MGLHLIRDWKLKRAVDKILDTLQPLFEDNADMKSIFASKTFWLNLLGGGAGLIGALPINKWTVAAGAGLNILLRLVTNQPVSLTGN